MARKYLLIAKDRKSADDFAEINKIQPSEYLYVSGPKAVENKRNMLAILIEGWREHKNHFEIVQAVNTAEIRGIKILDARPDERVDLEKV